MQDLKAHLHHCFCLLLTALLFLQIPYPVQPKDTADDAAIKHVLAPFAGRTVDGIFIYLDQIRPAPVKDSDKQFLMRNMSILTGETGVRDPALLQKLRQKIRPALALHRRIQVVDLYVFRYPYPVAMNKPGAFVALSTTMLDLIGDDESSLLGTVAHELAHEYVASEHFEALQKHDLAKMRELELFCDVVATATLVALGLDPAHYASLLERAVNSSPEAAKMNNGEREMPNVVVRRRLIAEVAAQLTT